MIVRSFGSSKNTKLEDGPYCTISGNEPSSVTLYKTGSESQTFCCNFTKYALQTIIVYKQWSINGYVEK